MSAALATRGVVARAGGVCPVIVMAKAPVPGYAKTRLVPALGREGAAALAARLLGRALDEALAADIGPVELCAAPDPHHAAFAPWQHTPGLALTGQGEGDLGARMHRAFARWLPLHGRAVLIGTDAPALGKDMLRAAARALADHDAVFAPACDGGYALVGLARSEPSLFDAMPWSTDRVMAETRSRIVAAGLHHAELPAVADIDEPQDLVHLPADWHVGAAP